MDGPSTRTLVSVVALLAFSACESRKSQPATAMPATDTAPADSLPGAVNSPDGSVRRSRPDEVVTGRAPLASECEGDACPVVTVAWLDPGFRFENTSSRDVLIRIWFAAQGDCLLSEFSITRSQNSGWGNTGFCKPYRATYK